MGAIVAIVAICLAVLVATVKPHHSAPQATQRPLVTVATVTPAPLPVDAMGRALIPQAQFPCEEDEALRFAPPEKFQGVRNIDPIAASRDYVICIHVDEEGN